MYLRRRWRGNPGCGESAKLRSELGFADGFATRGKTISRGRRREPEAAHLSWPGPETRQRSGNDPTELPVKRRGLQVGLAPEDVTRIARSGRKSMAGAALWQMGLLRRAKGERKYAAKDAKGQHANHLRAALCQGRSRSSRPTWPTWPSLFVGHLPLGR
jgi:hypothetical protein